ncbi:hypothetical protein B7494_g4090 [Chlorociboria aeruginascens]|nr:hypothetical protein B7494_g4090 [Chlorociboria aeruginascens]
MCLPYIIYEFVKRNKAKKEAARQEGNARVVDLEARPRSKNETARVPHGAEGWREGPGGGEKVAEGREVKV